MSDNIFYGIDADASFFTLDYEDGSFKVYDDIPYYVASPFNFIPHRLSEGVVVFVHQSASAQDEQDFIMQVKHDLGLA